MCGIVGILGQGAVAGQAGRGAEAARISRLRFGGRRDAGRMAACARVRAEGKLRNLEAKLRTAAARRGDRHRPHPLGDAWQADRNQRPSARQRQAGGRSQRNHRKFPALARGTDRQGPSIRAPRPTPRSPPSSSPTRLRIRQDARAKPCTPRCKRMRGAFALVFLFQGEDNLLIGARQGAPLAVGYGDGEMFLGSDALALAAVHRSRRLSRRGRLGDR